MTDAYLLIQTDGSTDGLAGSIRAVRGVVFAEDVRGPYDAIGVARSGADGDGLEGILEEIRALPGVIRALAAPLVAPAEMLAVHAA